jgi:hypothetical protein
MLVQRDGNFLILKTNQREQISPRILLPSDIPCPVLHASSPPLPSYSSSPVPRPHLSHFLLHLHPPPYLLLLLILLIPCLLLLILLPVFTHLRFQWVYSPPEGL